MIRLFIGSFAAAIAMFFAGFLYFAGPIAMLGYSEANELQSATVQTALAANLPTTGTYMIPNPATQSGTTLYGRGPIATVNYNSNGFSLESMDALLPGFILYLVVAVLMAGALSQLDRRVPDFRSRAVIVICFSLAASALMTLGNPIWLHYDWSFAIFTFVGDSLMLILGGLILARWFMPTKAEVAQTPAAAAQAEPSAQKAEDITPGKEIPPVGSTGL
jgi:hypothetical protein